MRVTPDTDPNLWDEEGVVVAWTNNRNLHVELTDGTDVEISPANLDPLEDDAPSPNRLFGV